MSWYILIFALALSLDGLGVGISYGMRKIKIPRISLIIICLASSTTIIISMLAGKMLASILSIKLAELLGGIVLIIMGSWLLLQAWAKLLETKEKNIQKPFPIFKFSIPSLGLAIEILKEPSLADIDNSGVISIKESLVLGSALAMDALGAGIGVAMLGFNPLATAITVGICEYFLINLGLFIGSNYSSLKVKNKLHFLPGLIIVFLGITRLL